jgi:hypothetical protein
MSKATTATNATDRGMTRIRTLLAVFGGRHSVHHLDSSS